MTKIIMNGAAGRMGTTIIRLTKDEQNLELVGATDHKESANLGKDAGELAGIGALGINIIDDLSSVISKADVIIDFSLPESAVHLLDLAVANKTPVVIGTTGHTDEQKKIFKKVAGEIPLIVSPNMSVGVNLLWKMAEMAGKVLGKDYEINIVEKHHIHKKDAPSGTAKRLIEVLTDATGHDIDKDVFYSLNGTDENNVEKPVKVKAIREGEIVGDHIAYFTSKEDRIEMAHFAFTRDIFARGALRAAEWIVGKPAGLYDMQDVLF